MVTFLFPASDYRHNVATPTLLVTAEALARLPLRGRRDVVTGLFLADNALRSAALPRRVVPELLCFLHDLLAVALADRVAVDGLVAAAEDGDATPLLLPATFGAFADTGVVGDGKGDAAATRVRGMWSALLTAGKRSKKKKKKQKTKKMTTTTTTTSTGGAGEAVVAAAAVASPISMSLLFHNDNPAPSTSSPFASDSFAAATLHQTLSLVAAASDCYYAASQVASASSSTAAKSAAWSGCLSFPELFGPIATLLTNVAATAGVATSDAAAAVAVRAAAATVAQRVRRTTQQRSPLTMEGGVHSIPEFKPVFVDKFRPGRDNDPDRSRAADRDAKRKAKSEKKGQMRELRKDAVFVEGERRRQQDLVDTAKAVRRKAVRTMQEMAQADSNLHGKLKAKANKNKERTGGGAARN
jgi:nucleolar protein 14